MEKLNELLDTLKTAQREIILAAAVKGGVPRATWFKKVGELELAIDAIEQLIHEARRGEEIVFPSAAYMTFARSSTVKVEEADVS